MAAVQVVVLCVAGAMVCVLLRAQKPEFRPAVGIAAALAALGLILPELEDAVQLFRTISESSGSGEQFRVLIRATGIAMIAEAGAQLCQDADEQALAGRVYLAARVVLLGMAAPQLNGLVQQLGLLMGI